MSLQTYAENIFVSYMPCAEVFMGFVKSYIQMFAYRSVTTDDWKNYLFTYFKDKVRNIHLYNTEGVFPIGTRISFCVIISGAELQSRYFSVNQHLWG